MEQLYKKFYSSGVDDHNVYSRYIPMEESLIERKNSTSTTKINNYLENESMDLGKHYMNNNSQSYMPYQYEPSNTRNLSAVDMKMHIFQEKLELIERKHQEEKQRLLDIINQNIITQNQLNSKKLQEAIKKEEDDLQKERDKKRSDRKLALEEARNKLLKESEDDEQKKKNEQSNNRFIDEIKDLKETILKSSLAAITANNQNANKDPPEQEPYPGFKDEFREFRTNVMSRIDAIDNRHKLQMESFRYILENSGSTRVKSLVKRIMGDEGQSNKKEFIKPSQAEIDEAISLIRKKK